MIFVLPVFLKNRLNNIKTALVFLSIEFFVLFQWVLIVGELSDIIR